MDRDRVTGILDRIRRFVRTSGETERRSEAFIELAREAFAFQVERIPPVRALAEARGVDPAAISDWREIPAVPALAFKSLDLLPRDLAAAGRERPRTFRSSGTTGRRRSVHRHPFPGLYRETVDAELPRRCLPRGPGSGGPAGPTGERGKGETRVPMLSLVPEPGRLPDSSLSFMVGHVVERWGTRDSAWVLGPTGLDADAASAWVRGRNEQDPARPCLVLATALALAAWLDRLEEAGERLPLPPGSVLFETGGFKGARRSVTRSDLLARTGRRLGVPPGRVVREYGMTELTSQLYTRVLDGGDPDLFVPPPWVRVRVLDTETLEEAPRGEVGMIAVLDLANLGSAIHVLTEDLGAMEPGGLRLAGRARGAELRGCSLVAEEMGEAGPGEVAGAWSDEPAAGR